MKLFIVELAILLAIVLGAYAIVHKAHHGAELNHVAIENAEIANPK